LTHNVLVSTLVNPPAGPQRPFVITPHLRSLIDPQDPTDPIALQFVPTALEQSVCPGESPDPLDERRVEVVPRLLHRYPDRVLLLVTRRCAAYCRFCFRRETTGSSGDIRPWQLRTAATYVAAHPEIREVILSGGDPLMLPPARLAAVLGAFRRPGSEEPALRIHTRLPVALPDRVTEGLAESLGAYRPLRMVLHVNHPRELTPQLLEAAGRLRRAGLELLSQGVLLRGVNDHVQTLAELWRRLTAAGIRPHYLFQPDLARGTAHFRLDLELARRLYAAAAALAYPAAIIPPFALDLPGGLGKALLAECRVSRVHEELYRVEAPDGRSALYPRDARRIGGTPNAGRGQMREPASSRVCGSAEHRRPHETRTIRR
jgi:lysine 2,3-aminomutase